MNVERDIAGFALPFAVGVLVTACSGTIFCGSFNILSFITLLIISGAVMLLSERKSYDHATVMQWILISTAALCCGVLSAMASQCMFDMPQSGFEAFCADAGLHIKNLIDDIPFRSEECSALIKALLTGDRGGLSADMKSAFRDSGASHILALSGLHLGIIYGIISKLLSVLGNGRTIRAVRSLLIICICGIYTLSTGAGDSLVRALIFISLREVAMITCRYHGLGQILLASLIIQLVLDPLAIRSVSFQLSYAAMAGIAFIYPWLQNVGASLFNPMKWIWNTVALSISCQLTTGPIAYLYFGTFPKYFILTNLLTLPLTGLLIPAALLTLVLSCLGCCPLFMVHVTEWLVSTLIWMLQVISTM